MTKAGDLACLSEQDLLSRMPSPRISEVEVPEGRWGLTSVHFSADSCCLAENKYRM